MQSNNASSTSSLSPLASFLKNSLRLSDYDSIQVVADNAKLPQTNGDDDSPVQKHLSPSATRQRRTNRRVKVDRWGNSISQDEEERSLSPVPVRRGGDAMSRRQDSLDRYYTEILAHLGEELPPPPFPLLEEDESAHPFDNETGEQRSFGQRRKLTEKAKKNGNILPRPNNEKGSIAKTA
eukprot:scaffold5709_cov100-Cylindrotheca_fusiformis.AAC.6